MPRPDTLASEIEKLVGRAAREALEGASGTEEDPLLAVWVQRLGAQVAAHSDRKELPPQFALLGSAVANALTLPGSKVFVTRGLLDEVASEDELVGVLAHEAAHVAKRHAWQQLVGNASFLLALSLIQPKSRDLRLGATVLNLLRALGQSRSHEYQADAVGIGFASAAGYHPEGLAQFIEHLASGQTPWWAEYFATHPPGEKRAERSRKLPLLATSDPSSRASTAAGFDHRHLPALAELVRRGRSPLALPPRLFPPTPPELAAERADIYRRSEKQLQRLTSTYRPLATAGTLQQLLLLSAQTTDLRFIVLATHAYLLQFKIQDVYAKTVRLLRTAPAIWDGLVPPATDSALDARLGRDEVLHALLRIEAAPDPLRHATEASFVVLSDLNLGRFYRLSGTAQWARIGVIEGLIQYAERELLRAERAADVAGHTLGKARVRYYRAFLNRLVPETDLAARLCWQRLLERRLGRPILSLGPTGEATIRAAYALQRGCSDEAAQERRGTTPWGDWVARNGGIPENIATMLRLVTLEIERELAAAAFLKHSAP